MKLNASTNALQDKIAVMPRLHKALVILGTVLVLAAGFYFLKYQDQADRIGKLNREVENQKKRVAEVKRAVAEVEKLKADLAKSESDFSEVLSRLPDQKEIPGLLESVSLLGNQVGLESVLFQPQPEQAREFYSIIPVKLELSGTFQNVGTFLDSVSKLNRILKVENMNLTRQKGDSRLKVECLMVTYRFIEKPEAEKTKKK